jgi:hypothetical protein
MRKTVRNQYRFTNPPQSFRRARLDNIAIVPASALPYRDSLREILNDLPKGGVLLCHSGENPKQDRILKSVAERFRNLGHAVVNLTLTPEVYGTLKAG